jgi:sugar phosphate isomerase/epimerase
VKLDRGNFGLCWGSLRQASLVDLISAAGDNGFAAITVSPALYAGAHAAGVGDGELRSRLRDAGIRVSTIDPLIRGLPGIPDLEDIPAELRMFFEYSEDDCFRAAEALEATAINVAHFLGRALPPTELAQAVAAICDRATHHDCTILFEFIPGTGSPDLASAATLLSMVGRENAALTVDVWHLSRSGGRAGDLRQLRPHSIGTLQLCDRITPPPNERYVPMADRSLPGQGELPLLDIVSAVRAVSPSARIELEVFSAELRCLSPAEAGRTIAARLATWIDWVHAQEIL